MRAWISGRLPIDALLAFAFGVVFLAITILLELLLGGEETSLTIRVTLALAAAGIGAGIPGLLNFDASTGKGLAIKGSGAMVFFLVVYLVNPLSSQPNSVPDIEQFTVEPSRIMPGQAVTIAWRAKNADIVRLLPLNKEWQNDQSVSGSVTTVPFTDTTYVLELLVKGVPVASREAAVVVSLPACTAKAEQVILRTGPGERFPEVTRLNKRFKLTPIDYSTREYQPDGRVIQSEWLHVRWEGENSEGWAPVADLDCPSGILDVLPAASIMPSTPTVTHTPTSTPTPTVTPQVAKIRCTANGLLPIYAGPGSAYAQIRPLRSQERFDATGYLSESYDAKDGRVGIPFIEISLGDDSAGWVKWAWNSIDCDGRQELEGILPTPVSIPPTPVSIPPLTLAPASTPTATPISTPTLAPIATPTPSPTATMAPTPLPPKILSFSVSPTEVVPGQVVLITFAFENADKAELLASPSQNGMQPELLPIGGGNVVPRDLADQVQHRPAQTTTYELILKDAADIVLAKRRSRVDLVAPACVVNTTVQFENLQLRSGPGTLYASVPSKSNSELPALLPNEARVTALGYTPPTGLEREGVAFTWIKIEYQTIDGLQEGWLAWTFLKCAVDYTLLPLIAKDNWPPTPTPRAQATPTAIASPTATSVAPLPPTTSATPLPPVVFGPYQVVSNGSAGCAVWERSFQLPDPRMVLDTSQGGSRGYALVVNYQHSLDSLGPGSIDQLGGMQQPVVETTIGVNGREEVRVTVPVCPTRLVQSSSPFGGSRVRWVDHVAAFEVRLFGRHP